MEQGNLHPRTYGFKVGQDLLQDGRGNKCNKAMERGSRTKRQDSLIGASLLSGDLGQKPNKKKTFQ